MFEKFRIWPPSKTEERGAKCFQRFRNGIWYIDEVHKNSLLRKFEELDIHTFCACIGWIYLGEEVVRGSRMGPFAFEDVTGCPNGLFDNPSVSVPQRLAGMAISSYGLCAVSSQYGHLRSRYKSKDPSLSNKALEKRSFASLP